MRASPVRAAALLALALGFWGLAAVVHAPDASAASCDAPTITGLPAGTLRQGTVLTGNRGGSCTALSTQTLVWQRCTAPGTDCVDISLPSGAATLDYTVVAADRAHYLRVLQTVRDALFPIVADTEQPSSSTSKVFGLGPPTAAFTPTSATVKRNVDVAFNAGGSSDPDGDTLTYQWNFGDGATTTGVAPTHAYATSGTKTVTLTVTDGDGETDSIQHNVTVKFPPVAAFTATPSAVKRNVNVAFNAGGSSDPDSDPISSYQWNFGDGATATGVAPTHAYATSGTKTVTLTVTADGESTAVTHSVKVKFPPVAKFVSSSSAPLAGETVTFVSLSSDADADGLSYAWDLDGDGSFDDSTARVAKFAYPTAGTFTVSLRVTADGESNTAFASLNVQPAATPPTPTPAKPTKLKPFPVVTIAGRFTQTGVILTKLTVRAPKNSKVTVLCSGKDCPKKSSSRRVGASRKVRLRRYQRRLRAGTVLKIFVRKPGKIGKYTRFLIRRAKPPARRDRCLVPGKSQPVRCSTV